MSCLGDILGFLEAKVYGQELNTLAETAFTTFWPRYYIEDDSELASYYEKESPDADVTTSPNVKPFFDHAKALGIDVAIGYGEDTGEEGVRYNTAAYVSGKTGNVLNKYRKVSCPV